jgi:hypothetical protein
MLPECHTISALVVSHPNVRDISLFSNPKIKKLMGIVDITP